MRMLLFESKLKALRTKPLERRYAKGRMIAHKTVTRMILPIVAKINRVSK
jgi:hypothetical protein